MVADELFCGFGSRFRHRRATEHAAHTTATRGRTKLAGSGTETLRRLVKGPKRSARTRANYAAQAW